MWRYLSVDEGLPHRYVNAILPISDGRLLVGTGHLNRGGMAMLERAEGIWSVTDSLGYDDGIPGDKVRWLFLDGEGRLWITTESNGILLARTLNHCRRPP